MKTNRQLLEAAAKAAGISAAWYFGLGMGVEEFSGVPKLWDPLKDDGDAMRLKVRLHLIVGSYATYTSVTGTYTPGGYEVPNETIVWHHETGGDACAAERLAITRCAAAIAAAMPAALAVGAA